ncbi:MAG TPA: hypothetical protein VE935_07565 [Burkholderiales bacterium]|nr:hypothetical protein [Burkholderiales bacterium]
MAARRLLYFTAEDHTLYRRAGGALELEAKFSGDEPGLDAFRQYLRAQRGGLFAVLADLAGEDFHEEQIPYVRGSDREAVIARRLAQRYRDTRLVTSLSLGQVAAGERRNERLLLASFTNTQQLTPWLDALEEADVRLSGVYSVPLLAPMLAAALRARHGRQLLVTANRAGLRQCYIDHGRLRFARLERTAEMAPEALALFVRSETQRLAQYLVTLRALPRDGGPVQVLVIAPAGQRSAFEQALVSDNRLVFRTVDYAQALRAVRLRHPPEGAAAEALYLHLAARRAPREQFASREERRRYFIWQLQRATIAAGALAFAACALLAGGRWIEAVQMREDAAAQRLQAREAASRYERITAAFPVTETTTDNLKATVVEFRRIAERSASPERAFIRISRVLEQFPQVELETLRWSVGRPAEARGAAQGVPSTNAADNTAVLIELSGRVNATQRNDYRGVTAQVQRLAAAFAAADYELVRTQLPFDVTSQGTLSGDIGSGESTDAPRFTIVLARRLP